MEYCSNESNAVQDSGGGEAVVTDAGDVYRDGERHMTQIKIVYVWLVFKTLA